MNGVHDMGGMQGMGPVNAEQNEPVFHAPWEGRALALNLAASAWRKWNIDASRYEIELIPAADYLRMSYYEKWTARLEELLIKAGLVTPEEIASGLRRVRQRPRRHSRLTRSRRCSARALWRRGMSPSLLDSRQDKRSVRATYIPTGTRVCHAMRAGT